ncbi:protein of unknown function (plasmid) [Carnobacterium divergens]|nr:protein of unknown function [Carnobacterium divergens]
MLHKLIKNLKKIKNVRKGLCLDLRSTDRTIA